MGGMEFDERLRRAIERGEEARAARGQADLEREMTLEELRTLHSRYRVEISDHIENALRKLVEMMPGFEFSTVMNDDGWGGRIYRDDLNLTPGKGAESLYSRLEVFVPPFTPAGLLEIVVKGTVRNREVLNRTHFQKLAEIDLVILKDMIDMHVLEFAERFSAAA